MLAQDAMAAARAEALAHIQKASLVRELTTITAGSQRDNWPVKIKVRAGEYFEVTGRGTGLDLYLTETNAGYLVAVPNFNRCGHVPADCNAYDVADYVGIENRVDATTLAAAIRYIISAGLACSHPSVSMLPEKGGDK